jgi:hypothetical protein
LFDKSGKKRWKVEYDDTVYKVYDSSNKLAGYFFPHYSETESDADEAIHQQNKEKTELVEGTLLVPMLKLDVFDSQGAIPVEMVISNLESGYQRAAKWYEWLKIHSEGLSIYGAGAHTAREDRNMLSIALGIRGKITLGEKGVKDFLLPLLDMLSADGLL